MQMLNTFIMRYYKIHSEDTGYWDYDNWNDLEQNKNVLFCSDADYGDYDYQSSTGCGAGGCDGAADEQGFGGIQPRKGGIFHYSLFSDF